MNIGVLKEVKDHEYRVSLTPDGASALRKAGHAVWVEPSAGAGSGFTDEEYRRAGATIASSKAEVFEKADLIVKVKEPLLSECSLFRPGQVLFTYLHLAANRQLTDAMLASGLIGIAYETVQRADSKADRRGDRQPGGIIERRQHPIGANRATAGDEEPSA